MTLVAGPPKSPGRERQTGGGGWTTLPCSECIVAALVVSEAEGRQRIHNSIMKGDRDDTLLTICCRGV